MKPIKVKFGFSTKDKFIEFELMIKVSTDFKFFFWSKELPEQLSTLGSANPRDRQYFDSYYELERYITGLIEEFEHSLIEETKEKVILYQIETEAIHGQRMDFKWFVCQRVITSSAKETKTQRYYTEEKRATGHYISSNLTALNTYSVFEDKFLQMAWSAEREAWFISMEDGIKKLAHQLNMGFGKTPEILARKIDQGMRLMIGNKGEENEKRND